jgi:UDP-N-acetylglucosamine 2-epimerase (non-hydrolysing)
VKKVLLTAGVRSGVLLLAPLYHALKKKGCCEPIACFAVEAGEEMLSAELAACFALDGADHAVQLSADSSAGRIAEVLIGMERVILSEKPDLVMVCGSDAVALGSAVAALQCGVAVASVDAGLRSNDPADSGEKCRRMIDALASLHIVSEHSGEYNLISEGILEDDIFFAGNLAIDSLAALMPEANKLAVAGDYGVDPKKFALVLLQGSSLFSGREPLEMLLGLFRALGGKTTILLPLYSAFDAALSLHGLRGAFGEVPGLRLTGPLGHIQLLSLLRDASFLLADSEEMQSEATVMQVPCLSMMEATTRPSTIEIGTSILVGRDEEDILNIVDDVLHQNAHAGLSKRSKIPEKWDGQAAQRIADLLGRVL